MYFLDELKDLKLYRNKFLLPINEQNKKKNSVAFLLTPNYASSKSMMNHELLVNKYFNSYYMERAAMYYINGSTVVEESTDCLLESITDIMNPDSGRSILYSGYENDIEDVMLYLNEDTLDRLNTNYNVSLPNPFKVEIFRKQVLPKNTETILNVSNKGTFNKSLKDYGAYLRYSVMEFILEHLDKKIPKELSYAISLYESDLFYIHKKNWIFSDRLNTLCKAIETYIDKHGHKRFVKDVVYGDYSKLFKKTGLDYTKNVIDNLFGLNESVHYEAQENEYYLSEAGALQVGQNCIILVQEAGDVSYNSIIKKLLYNDRIKNIKEMEEIYKKVKEDNAFIKYTYNKLELYRGLNLFLDLSRYNASFIKNNTFKMAKGYNVYMDLLIRLICDERLKENGYTKKTVIIPICDWDSYDKDDAMWLIKTGINPISCIYQALLKDSGHLKEIFGDTEFLFMGTKSYFKMNFSKMDLSKSLSFYLRNIKRLRDRSFIPDDDETVGKTSPKVVTANIVDKVEKTQGVEINDISVRKKEVQQAAKEEEPKTVIAKSNKAPEKVEADNKKDKDKKELVEKIANAAETNQGEEETLDALDNDERLKQILADLSEEPDNKSNISAARASRMVKLQDDLMEKEFKGKPLKELLNDEVTQKELPETSLKVASVNNEWEHMQYCNSFSEYNIDKDIVQIFNSFSKMNPPLNILSIESEDTSTSEDAVETYTVKYEDENGKRFTIKLDIPKFIDDKYMMLRGNRKDISSQLFLMPIIKTGDDTVQIVSNYNKIFIRRYGTTAGKSMVTCDKLIKTINKNEFKHLKVIEGNNSMICNRYELPIDYIDLASIYNKLTTPTYTISFNQLELREKYKDKIDLNKGIPFGINNKDKSILYYNSIDETGSFVSFSTCLVNTLASDNSLAKENFIELYEKASTSVRYTYSKASILSTEIPVVVLCAYSEGLTTVLKKANIKFRLSDNKKLKDIASEDYIKFNDGYLIYELDYASSLLMNGLKACDTASYSLSDMNNKTMYIDFLDNFGGRIKADGIDNFYNLMIDEPITTEVLKYYKLPTDYIEVLLYANRLLADNKFVKHTNITDNRRIRRNEQIPAMLYSVLAGAYGQYCTQKKHGRDLPMSLKQSAVIDEVLKNSTTSDKSIINALAEYEAYSTVTAKGPSGMNSDRSYTLDKRSYDDSMLGVLGMSTGFAGNVGVVRQATIDANVSTARGYITNNNVDNSQLSPTKSLCMTESLTPFGTTRDDPFRTAMTYVQTSKHYMRCRRSNPSLITTGADEALPYLISNIFAHKASQDGEVVSINEDRMVVKYKDGTHEYINLREEVEKNSSSGFYVTLKLDTDLKEGKKFKAGEILAYDKESFSSNMGEAGNITYNIGTLSKVAILNTDEGFEDSAIISEDLSKAMTSDVILMCPNHPIILPKDTNIFNMVKVGQKVEEGDILMTIQNTFDDEDANALLKNLTDDEEEISELGRRSITSKVTGVVQDIIMYRTVEKDELSPSLRKLFNAYEKDINDRKKEMKEFGIESTGLIAKSTEALPPVGKLKNASDGVVIEIYVKYEDKMSVGDKLIYYSANKGVVKDIFPAGDEPYSSYRPKEKVHSVLSSASINARKVCSILVVGSINKYLIELDRKCKDILGIKYNENLFEE